jgi:hypothetical protein
MGLNQGSNPLDRDLLIFGAEPSAMTLAAHRMASTLQDTTTPR